MSLKDNRIKYINAAHCLYSLIASSISKKVFKPGMPLAINAELTNHCNLKCPECITGSGKMTRPSGFMDISLYSSLLKQLRPYLFNVNLYFQGEPMLHPDFFSFAESCRPVHSTVSTNGHFIDIDRAYRLAKSNINKVIISLDGPDQETYSVYRRNGRLDVVLDGIRNLAEAKRKSGSTMIIEVQVLVNKINEGRIPEIRKLLDNFNVSMRLKSMQIYTEEGMQEWLPSSPGFRRYRLTGGRHVLKGGLPGSCARLWFSPVVTWDGKILPCCFDKNGEHVMGDISEKSFREIWYGKRFNDFRKELLFYRNNIEICRNCTSGLTRVNT